MHDATVERTTDGRGVLEAMSLEELKRLDAGPTNGPSGGRRAGDYEKASRRRRRWDHDELAGTPHATERRLGERREERRGRNTKERSEERHAR